MKIFHFLKRGAIKAIVSYKLILVIWFITLISVFLVALPLRSSLEHVFGPGLAADMLLKGFNAGIIADMGPALGQLLSAATKGGTILLLAGFFLFVFFAGGLFSRYTSAYSEVTVPAFMKASAHHFFVFSGISLLMLLFVLLWTVIIVVIPALIVIGATEDSVAAMKLVGITRIIWLLGMPVLLLAADHSRRWVASTGSHRLFRAVSEGFSSLRKRFLTSYFSVLVILLFNIAYVILTAWIIAVAIPEKGYLVFLFFLATQILFIIRLFLKAWRYATVTELADSYR